MGVADIFDDQQTRLVADQSGEVGESVSDSTVASRASAAFIRRARGA